MRKKTGTKEKVEAMEAERQRRIDALPEIPRWGFDIASDDIEPDESGAYVRHSDYEAMTEWLRAENARLRMGDTWPEQRKGYEAEVMRLQAHVERGRDLIHRVTSTIGQKQAERDMANMRLEAVDRMLVTMVKATESGRVLIDLEAVKADKGKHRLVTTLEDGYIVLTAEEVTEEKGDVDEATDTIETVVSAPDERDNVRQFGGKVPVEPDPDLQAD